MTPAPKDPAARLATLAAALEAGEQPDPEAARAFAAGVRAWLEGETRSLDAALRVGGAAGLEGARNRYRRARRDRHLRLAHSLVTAGGPWSRCVALAEAVERFEARIWPRWQHLAAPPEGCAEINAHLFHARRLNGRPLPATAEGIRLRVTQEQPPRDLASAA